MNVKLQLLVLIAFPFVLINGDKPLPGPKADGHYHGRLCPVSSLPAVANAQHPVVTDPLPEGSVVTYTCNDGFSPAPGSDMDYTCDYTCGGTGQWTGNPACYPVLCLASLLLDVANAQNPVVTGALTVGSVVTYTCNAGFVPAPGSTMQYTCDEIGEWTGNPACFVPPYITAADGTLWRLSDGSGPGINHPSKGRIEVNINGSWGTVCDDTKVEWDKGFNLDVVCKTFGFSGSNGRNRRAAYFGPGTGPILMDNVRCLGNETVLTDCYYSPTHNCNHGADQGVECVPNSCVV